MESLSKTVKRIERLLVKNAHDNTINQIPDGEKQATIKRFLFLNVIIDLLQTNQISKEQLLLGVDHLISLNTSAKPYFLVWQKIITGELLSLKKLQQMYDNNTAQTMLSSWPFIRLRDNKNREICADFIDLYLHMKRINANEELFDFVFLMKNRLRRYWDSSEKLVKMQDYYKQHGFEATVEYNRKLIQEEKQAGLDTSWKYFHQKYT